MCLYPILITNPKYKENKKNGGVIPHCIDSRIKLIPIGCGKCIECKKKKAREWQIRITEEVKQDERGKFITLTFSNESIKKINEELDRKETKENKRDVNGEIIISKGYKRDNEIATYGVRHWLENIRAKYKKSVKHWLVTELGGNGTENIHLHGIVWCEDIEEITNKWIYGYVWNGKTINEKKINYVNAKTANYITKYMCKLDEKHKHYNSIILCSKGIGKGYVDKNKDKKDIYVTESGHKIGLSIYYRNKIFTEEEREKLWIEKIDKGVRYIGGKEYRNDDYNGIMRALKNERKLNKELGYGDGSIEWNEKEYEENMRELNNKKRIFNIK